MKNYLLVLGILLLAHMPSIAQNSETITIKAGSDIASAVSDYGIYRFPVFVNGTVLFTDGKLARAMMNFNILNSQMMYIDKKGDTLTIANPEEVIRINLNDIVFYKNKRDWLEIIANAVPANLVVRRQIAISYMKEGAFGIPNGSNAIDSYNNYTFGNTSYHLSVVEDVTLKKMTDYFLRTAQGVLLPASKTNFLRQFAKNKIEIQHYLVTNKVNFNNERDLVRLLAIATSMNADSLAFHQPVL